jgi:hypothetical protein
MSAIAKVVAWSMGAVILLGTSADTLARPKLVAGKTYCMCNCATEVETRDLMWENVGSCTGANNKKCSIKRGDKTYSGKLNGCTVCKADAEQTCTAVRVGGAAEPGGVAPPREGTRRPPARETK